MRAPTISAELKHAMKQLRLGKLLDTLPERLALAKKDAMPIEDFLLLLLTDEIERRRSSAATRRAEDAGLDPGTCPPDRTPGKRGPALDHG